MNEYREQQLIVTTTYSVKESKGNALGLEGNQALYVVAGVFVSFLLMFYGMVEKWSTAGVAAAVVIPPLLSIIYVLIFLRNKPPGYQKSLLHRLILGSSDDVEISRFDRNPYQKALRKSRK